SATTVPAEGRGPWPAARWKKAQLLLQFVRERGAVHPREVDDHFSHGTVRNYWGGSSNATTHLLDAMHYSGMLRVARREGGIRIYAAHQHEPGPADAAARRAGRCGRPHLRAAAWPVPVGPCAPAALCRAAVAQRVEGCLAAGQAAA